MDTARRPRRGRPLTPESHGAPANANAPPRAGFASCALMTMGVTGRGARRRLALDAGSAPRELEWGGRRAGPWRARWDVRSSRSLPALALVASTGAGGDLRRRSPRPEMGSAASDRRRRHRRPPPPPPPPPRSARPCRASPSPGPRTNPPGPRRTRRHRHRRRRQAERHGGQSSGDFYWLPVGQLLGRTPGVKITLADPTHD